MKVETKEALEIVNRLPDSADKERLRELISSLSEQVETALVDFPIWENSCLEQTFEENGLDPDTVTWEELKQVAATSYIQEMVDETNKIVEKRKSA